MGGGTLVGSFIGAFGDGLRRIVMRDRSGREAGKDPDNIVT